MPSTFEWTADEDIKDIAKGYKVGIVLLSFVLTFAAHGLFSAETPASYFKQWCIYIFLDSAWGNLFHLLLLVPARWIAARLPGSKVPPSNDERQWSEQEEEANDPSVIWPSPDTIAKLPPDWVAPGCGDANPASGANNNATAASKGHSSNKKRRSAKGKPKRPSATNKKDTPTEQPYYLNHIRGSTSIRKASQRVGAAMGTLLASLLLCSYSSTVSLDDIGLGMDSVGRVVSDLACGCIVGSSIIVCIFLMELGMGWIKVVGYFETVVPDEIFAINFAWDVLFHVGVSINEEVMLRGWMFILGCRGTLQYALEQFEQLHVASAVAIAASIILQSTLFALMHVHSPGSTMVSLINLFIGGAAAALNVMASGGVWLGIGWHFGWNITMGHILGRTTSGIPMSCAVVSVIPKPALPGKASYVEYHGGTFGPEMGVLAPLAYALGTVMVIWLYGWESLRAWVDRLAADVSESRHA